MTTIRGFYINLEERPDRKKHFLSEMEKIRLPMPNLEVERFNAIKHSNGALGCSMSHLRCIQDAKRENWEKVLIMEDDTTFLNTELFVSQLDIFLKSTREWDVLLLAGNNLLPYKAINNNCIQVFNCLTTTAYIVKSHYYDTLIINYKEGILNLMKEPERKKEYAIDKYWQRLQRKDKWYLLIPPSIVQYENYSDIEKKQTNFQDYMLNYNKAVIGGRLT